MFIQKQIFFRKKQKTRDILRFVEKVLETWWKNRTFWTYILKMMKTDKIYKKLQSDEDIGNNQKQGERRMWRESLWKRVASGVSVFTPNSQSLFGFL